MSIRSAPPKRVREEDVENPCSGRYEGGDGNVSVELIVDIDKIGKYSTSLGVLSGSIISTNSASKPWSIDAEAVYFKTIPVTVKVSGAHTNTREVTANVKLAFSNGLKVGGYLSARLSLDNNTGTWKSDLEITISGQVKKIVAKNLERKSEFFKEVNLDIDFTEKIIWPTVVLRDLKIQPVGMEDRKLDPFSAFEDAGLKLLYDPAHSEKVTDPTPLTPWTKADLYEAMMDYFEESEDTDENIWCMMGTLPPDKRYMGFSFNRKGKRGFGLFTKHSAFQGLESSCKKKQADAHRSLLHYFIHECGHCLGLKHSFEIGFPDSLSWMNYAHRYDIRHEPGSFYQNFKYKFSDQELVILRHSPSKSFRAASSRSLLSLLITEGYSLKSEAPDMRLADDDDDHDVESGYGQVGLRQKSKPKRKIGLDLKMQEKYSRGQLVSFEARVKNLGSLPVLIEGDLSVDSHNLQLYLTKPSGETEIIDSFVRPIHSGYTKPRVLYTSEDDERSDRYSELVTVGEGSDGYQIDAPGTYELRAVYNDGRYKASSKTYTIEVADDVDDDKEIREELRLATTLRASSSVRFKTASTFWQKIDSKTAEMKKSKVATLIGVMEGLANENARQIGSARKSRKGLGKTSYVTAKRTVGKKKLLQDTRDLVEYYSNHGEKSDNMHYSTIVMARGKMHVAEKNTQQADIEFNQMLADLMNRGTKHKVLTKLSKRWNNIKNPPAADEKYAPENLQRRVNSILTWTPDTSGNGEPDLSGIGLGKSFSNFDSDHIQKAVKIVMALFTKYHETKDLVATIRYAEMLQKGREVNYMALRWALEVFIVHSNDAKDAGLKYPEPDYCDKSLTQKAAMMVTKREGEPSEDWMNYWRCDADFNYHHRHWHIVYVPPRFLQNIGDRFVFCDMPRYLERQGELFGYMHSQLLARYDAERESWGLAPVKCWEYEQTAMEFNAGFEFHNDSQWKDYVPRPVEKWPAEEIKKFRRWEEAYHRAVEAGEVAPNIGLDSNWSGHILEPSSEIYENIYGSIHNSGHDVFGKVAIPEIASDRNKISYMADTATAARDPIFYHWHKRIDYLWQMNSDHYRSEMADDAPPVTITADDIILNTSETPPADFAKMSNGMWVAKAPSEVTCLQTYLGPAKKKYEWDNKLSHEKFYYHLRMKRNDGIANDMDINLTIRVFICPKNRQQERTRWIEMDKFVCQIPAGSTHTQMTRADVHSSVIKRLHENVYKEEAKLVKQAAGFCECGWPYDMLLPRGKKDGEDYVICVIATDNTIDSIGISTSCGSMSYCGAKNEKYPDKRNMGYPFSNPITYKGQIIPIPTVFDKLTNVAYKDFKIANNVDQPPPMKAIDCWWPYLQLGVKEGTHLRPEPEGPIIEYIRSSLTGKFRVLIDTNFAGPSEGGRLLIRFQGRGAGGGEYVMRDATLALREKQTINTVNKETANVYVKEQKKFTIPEAGVLSDPLELDFDPAKGDYFLTFTLDSPGVYLPSSHQRQTATYYLPRPWMEFGTNGNMVGRFAYIQCVSGIMREISDQENM